MSLPIDPGLLLVLTFLGLVLLEVPIAVSLGVAGMFLVIISGFGAQIMAPIFFANISKFSLLAIPFFILAGVIMGRTGISTKIVKLVSLIIGPIRGGLAIVTVIVALFWGAVSGSGPATVAALGTILIPGMVENGYSRPFAAALVSASSGLAIIIPPSIAFIVYGVITNVSISKLFLAGIMPGVTMGLALILAAFLISLKRDYRGKEWGTLREVWAAFKDAFWGLIAPVIILGGIYGGVFTPTEAAAVAVFYGLFVGFVIYRSINLKDLYNLLIDSAVASAVVMAVVALAGIFGWCMTVLGTVEKASSAFLGLSTNPMIILLIINLLLLIAGMLLDAVSIYYLLLPVLFPVVMHFRWDPIWFGVLMTVNLAIGQVTPPVAVNLYVGCNIGKVSMDEISRAVMPFVVAAILSLLVISYWPGLTMWLPNLLMR